MADLGQKHVCFKCGSKFYDLRKPVAICPKCGANQADAPAVAAPVSAPAPAAPAKRGPRMVDPVEEELEPAEEEEEAAADDDLDLDAGDDDAGIEEELDEPAGEDSFD